MGHLHTYARWSSRLAFRAKATKTEAMIAAWRRLALTLTHLNAAAQLFSGCNNAEFICDPLEAPPAIDWVDIDERARIVFDVSCIDLTDDELAAKYGTPATEAIVRTLPSDTRYLLLIDRAQNEQGLFLPGTQFGNLEEIITNLDQAPIFDEELGATFHRGFLGAATGVRTDVATFLIPGFSIRLTGYSLGGATVAILALQLQRDGFQVESILTFGQPRVTDRAGAALFSGQPILRIKAGLDGVTHLFAPQYVHYGDEIILLDGDRIVYLNQNDRNYDASTDPDVLGEIFTDHQTYLTRIALKLDGTTQTSFCESERFITPAEPLVCE